MDVKSSLLYEGFYKKNMAIIRDYYLKHDFDWVHCIDGFERMGKSTLAIQTCLDIDPSFNINRICWTPRQYLNAVENAKKGQAVLYDEAGTGLFSREAMSMANRIINKALMTVGAKNLFHCIVIPNYMKLDSNIRENRIMSLATVYHRGKFEFRSRKRVRISSAKGYHWASRPNFFGNFGNDNPFKKEYEVAKKKHLQEFFDGAEFNSDIDVTQLDAVISKVKGNVTQYSKLFNGNWVVDISLIMHDFNLGRGNADKVKRVVQRDLRKNVPVLSSK